MMETELRKTARRLLAEKKVEVVIGYGLGENDRVVAIFLTDPAECDRLVWNDRCTQNLAVYLTRAEIKKLGRCGVVLKGCDAKSVVVLFNEGQLLPDTVYRIGMVCDGVTENGRRCDKCEMCADKIPAHVEERIGDTAAVAGKTSPREDRFSRGKYEKLAKLLAMTPQDRLDYWAQEFSRCVRCHACRQNCPLCYCNVCVADKNRPIRIETSATLRGNFAWNILRAFHLAGRCVGCGACTAACPAKIDLDLLNLALAETAETEFGFLAGAEPGAPGLIGTFSEDDKEDFIR